MIHLLQGAAENVIIFSRNDGGILPDCREVFKADDKLKFGQNDGSIAFQTILNVVNATTIQMEDILADAAAWAFQDEIKILRNNYTSDERRVKRFTIIYQPPLSIFGVNHAISGSSKHEMDSVPFSDAVYQKNAIESSLQDRLHSTNNNNDFRFKVVEMLFKAARCDGSIIEKDEFFLDLEETRCQIASMTANTRSQHSLDVSPATHAKSVAFQDEAAETNTLYSQSKFKIRNNEELLLNNFYIRYGGIQKPQPDCRPRFDINAAGEKGLNVDLFTEQWYRSVMCNGSHNDGSGETLEQWRNRGYYLHSPWPKTGTDRETRVYVSTQFSQAVTGTARLLLFKHLKKVCTLEYENGFLSQVTVNEV